MNRECDRVIEKEDPKAIERIKDDFHTLKMRVLFGQGWYWKWHYDYLSKQGDYLNIDEAARLIGSGGEAVERGDVKELEEVVFALWALRPKDAKERDAEAAMQAGIRRVK